MLHKNRFQMSASMLSYCWIPLGQCSGYNNLLQNTEYRNCKLWVIKINYVEYQLQKLTVSHLDNPLSKV